MVFSIIPAQALITPPPMASAVEVPSVGKSTLHAWFLNQSRVREWIGPRQYNNLSSKTWEVFNKDYELSYQFHRNQIDDDLEGLVAEMDARLAEQDRPGGAGDRRARRPLRGYVAKS